MEDLLQQIFTEPKKFMDHLHEHEHEFYDLDIDEEELKSKSDKFIHTTSQEEDVEDLQLLSMKNIHQTTLKYIHKDCKKDLLQWYQEVKDLPWTLHQKLASEASNFLHPYINEEYLIGWIEKILPVDEVLNERMEKVAQFREKNPRYLELYFLLMINYLYTDEHTLERYLDDCWEHWDYGGMEAAASIDFTCPEEVMRCINKNRPSFGYLWPS